MKTLIALSALLFASSVSAACNCQPIDRPCLDKCVMTANSCIADCDKQGSKDCRQACITANWPLSVQQPELKVTLEDKNATSSVSAAPKSSAPSSASIAPSAISSSVMLARPTSASASPKPNVDTKASGASNQGYSTYAIMTGVVVGSLVLLV
ncbi:hypothetical protein BD560DRAFT_421230 [Blakeslea trispora]|nr:hypothetical protein BD560DRAFT_421230 [Blakeslea trispora]